MACTTITVSLYAHNINMWIVYMSIYFHYNPNILHKYTHIHTYTHAHTHNHTKFLLASLSLPFKAPGRSPSDGSINFASFKISATYVIKIHNIYFLNLLKWLNTINIRSTFWRASPRTFQFLSPSSLINDDLIWPLHTYITSWQFTI